MTKRRKDKQGADFSKFKIGAWNSITPEKLSRHDRDL
jgi:hypothetical protein